MANNTGWQKVWQLYPFDNLRKGLKRPIPFFIILFIVAITSDKPIFDHIVMVSSFINGAFPSIIGFILAGYTIILGCSNVEYLRPLCRMKTKNDNPFFQEVNATFTIVIAVMVMTLLFSFVISTTANASCRFWFDKGCNLFNWSIAILITYFALYSLISLLDILINLFNYGQYICSKVAKEPKENSGEKEHVEKTTKLSIFSIFNVFNR